MDGVSLGEEEGRGSLAEGWEDITRGSFASVRSGLPIRLMEGHRVDRNPEGAGRTPYAGLELTNAGKEGMKTGG